MLLLGTGTRGRSVTDLADELLVTFGGLRGLIDTHPVEISRVAGIGKAKAGVLVSALALGKRVAKMEARSKKIISNPIEAASIFMAEMRFLTKEHFRSLVLDTKNQVLADELVSIGTLNSSLVHPREVFRPAILRSGAAVILGHNHPSGVPTPSAEDISLTKRLAESGKLLGIQVLDHLVVGDNTFVSLREKGIL